MPGKIPVPPLNILEATSSNLFLLLENSEEVSLVIDRHLNIIYFNKAARSIVKELINMDLKKGRSILNFADVSQRDILQSLYADAFSGRKVKAESKFTNSKDNAVFFQNCLEPLTDQSGNISHVLLTWEEMRYHDLPCKERNDTISRQLKNKLVKESNFLNDTTYKKLVENGSDIIATIDADGTYLYVNSAVSALGYESQFLMGKNLFYFVHSRDLSSVIKKIQSVRQTSQVEVIDFRYLAADGRWKWLETVATNFIDDPAINGIVLNSRDITLRKAQETLDKEAIENAIRLSEQRYRHLFHSNPLPMFAYDRDSFEFVMVNDAALKYYGYSRKEFLQLKITDIRPTEDWPRFYEFIKQHKDDQTKINKGEWRHLKKDGSVIECEIISHNLTLDNRNCRLAVIHDLTERNIARRELQRNETTLRAVSENFPNGFIMILDKDSKFEYVAGKELQQLNLSPDYFIGTSYLEHVGKRNMAQIKEQYEKILNGETVVFEMSFAEQTYLISGVPLVIENDKVEKVLVASQNVSKQKEALRRVHIQSNILENVNNLILVTDKDCKIIYYNNVALHVFGQGLLEYLNNDLFEIFPVVYQQEIKDLLLQLHGDEVFDVEVQMTTSNNTPLWLNFRFSIMYDEFDSAIGYLCMGQNITTRKQSEHEREMLIDELHQTVKDLRQFSYITSHNLRAPISNLIGITNLINPSTIINPETVFLVEKFKESAVQLNETVNDLMNVLLIKNNVNTRKELLDIGVIWQEVCASIQNIILDSGAIITADFSEANTILFNKSYLESILLNLLTNAIKYRSLKRKLTIDLIITNEEDYVVLHFKDNGLGIDLQRHQQKIFGLYQKFHDHPDSKGLGLYMVNSQVRAMGGKIEISSKVNQGTCFHIYFKK